MKKSLENYLKSIGYEDKSKLSKLVNCPELEKLWKLRVIDNYDSIPIYLTIKNDTKKTKVISLFSPIDNPYENHDVIDEDWKSSIPYSAMQKHLLSEKHYIGKTRIQSTNIKFLKSVILRLISKDIMGCILTEPINPSKDKHLLNKGGVEIYRSIVLDNNTGFQIDVPPNTEFTISFYQSDIVKFKCTQLNIRDHFHTLVSDTLGITLSLCKEISNNKFYEQHKKDNKIEAAFKDKVLDSAIYTRRQITSIIKRFDMDRNGNSIRLYSVCYEFNKHYKEPIEKTMPVGKKMMNEYRKEFN